MDKLDKYDIRKIQEKKTKAPNTISVGITWVDGRILWKATSKLSKFFYGICHFSQAIFAITPLDFIKPTLVTTLMVSPYDNYCEKSYHCLDTECPLNKFNSGVFEMEYKKSDPDFVKSVCRKFSKGRTLWMNRKPDRDRWVNFKIGIYGGTLKYNEEKGKELGLND